MSEKYLSQRPCPICEEHQGALLTRLCYALFDDLKMPGDKTLVQCNTCGMLYDDVHFSEGQLQEYYFRNEHYAVSTVGGSGSISDDNKERYDRIIKLLKVGSGRLILDFGCGQGGFVSRCSEHGLEAVGIEPSTKSREVAKKSGLSVYESIDAFVTKNPGSKVGAVVSSHVLEHLLNPIQLVQDFSKYFHNALVYIEVPDADSYLSPNKVRWQEMYFEHLSHFRKQNIVEFARRSCIEIENEGEIPFSRLQNSIRCRFIVGRFVLRQQMAEKSAFSWHNINPFLSGSPLTVDSIPQDGRPLALWGVSQYAMLLLGSCIELPLRVRRIFDASPAKIGRTVKGIVIEPSSKLGTLSDDFILFIPKSNSLPQMLSILPGTGFKGTAVEV